MGLHHSCSSPAGRSPPTRGLHQVEVVEEEVAVVVAGIPAADTPDAGSRTLITKEMNETSYL